MTSELFPRNPLQIALDFLLFPIRTLILSEAGSERFGLRSLAQERLAAVWPHLQGRILDIGAGSNRLVQLYKNGVGVDVYPGAPDIVVVDDSARLPFENGSFDTVCFLACLNHIPKRLEALQEARRLLRPNGRCIITMIDPWIGYLNHRLCWYDESHHRHTDPGEKDGLWPQDVHLLLQQSGFKLQNEQTFLYGLNRFYIAGHEPHPH